MSDGASAEPTRPKDLVFTLFGEYLLERVDAVWVGSLISLLEPFGLSEGAVRTILSRMTRRGWLSTERVGKHAVYRLTDRGRDLLQEGQSRIMHPRWDRDWDGRWLLLAYSIPQEARSARDRLRDRLAWLGFGSIGNGIWISPHDVDDEIRVLSSRMQLEDHLLSFRVDPLGPGRTEELVARCWDLAGLDRRYRAFTERWAPEVAAFGSTETGPSDPSERAFRLRFELIHEYRRFPLEDPYLPRELLPEPWWGDRASRLFRELRDALVGPADAWVDQVLARSAVGDERS